MANDCGAAGRDGENHLRHQESETLVVALKSIGDGVIVTDVAGCVTFLNPVAERITGWSLADARKQPFGRIFHIVNEHSGEPVQHPVAKVLETGGIVGLANHTILIARDGRRVPIDDSGAPVRLPNGELIGIVVVFRDVTERRRAEHERALLAAIIDSSDDAIASKTLEGIVTSWNPAATRLFGYQPAEIIGKPITTVIPPELHAEEAEILARLKRGERIDHYETVRLAKDGHRIDISLSISPVKGRDGTTVAASKIARDITQRKRIERLLREADQQKDEFLATLAHELRNPLAPICAAAELLKNAKSLAPELRAATAILERQARHMTHLVDDLLDISRITSGRIRLQQDAVELGELVKSLIETHRHSLQAARHEANLALPDAPVHVSGDRVRLTQILSNLLHNAVKYTPPGGRIEIALHTEDRQAIVSVRDNGIGIPAERLKHIFEPFAQLDTSYRHGDGGLGIGLMLAKKLVGLHGGSIEARSAGRGQGTEFLIRLPIITPAPAKHTSASPRAAESSASCRVLIADDNHDAAVSLSMLLQALGHDTRVVHDGIEALEEAELFRPEVVLLDIGMPRLDGYETARRLRSRPWAAATRIVAVTGWGQETDRQRAKEAGFDRHLVKPVNLDALSELVSSACE
ncbi:MAG TPA: PAS domain S-box protein [Steroidobacteraceae bacterium]|jgi:PAS domain S-box-containing protein|nr:PAS domain S-box protein [Steroidobacteraceae bacterium]